MQKNLFNIKNMIIQISNLNDFNLTGVYKIVNLINGHYYIGSTKQSFRIRYNHHMQALNNKNHKNLHLQHAYDKYGDRNFKFCIVEICKKENTYEREQHYLDIADKTQLYNINLTATGPCEQQESKEKQIKSYRKYLQNFCFYYYKFKNNELSLDQIPEKFHKKIKSTISFTPWNKGKKYNSTEHLKVPHKKSDRSSCKTTIRNKQPLVYVYDTNWNFIDVFRSAKDLEELSVSLILPIKSRFSVKRGNCPLNCLQSGNINKAIKTKTSYKGLFFTNSPVHQGIDDLYEPKSVKNWNVNTEVTKENNKSFAPYSVETETIDNIE